MLLHTCIQILVTLRKPLSQFHSERTPTETVALIIHRVNDLKTGNLIGIDKYGNKYYEDKRNFFGKCANVNTSHSTVQLPHSLCALC